MIDSQAAGSISLKAQWILFKQLVLIVIRFNETWKNNNNFVFLLFEIGNANLLSVASISIGVLC